MIDNNKVQQLHEFIQWVQTEANISASFTINFKAYKFKETTTIIYELWVEGIDSISTEDIDLLLTLIPFYKEKLSHE